MSVARGAAGLLFRHNEAAQGQGDGNNNHHQGDNHDGDDPLAHLEAVLTRALVAEPVLGRILALQVILWFWVWVYGMEGSGEKSGGCTEVGLASEAYTYIHMPTDPPSDRHAHAPSHQPHTPQPHTIKHNTALRCARR